jgi:hypothetical protein
MEQYRQGDVFIERIESLPTGLSRLQEPGEGVFILAHGEVTGHAHRIEATEEVMFFKDRARRTRFNYLRILPGQAVALRHEEHAPIVIPPGDYVVRRQREYVPRQKPRLVAD